MKDGTLEIAQRELQPDSEPGDDVIRRIAKAIRGVRYGSIEVVIQDSRVVQIERKEKFRLDKNGRG